MFKFPSKALSCSAIGRQADRRTLFFTDTITFKSHLYAFAQVVLNDSCVLGEMLVGTEM